MVLIEVEGLSSDCYRVEDFMFNVEIISARVASRWNIPFANSLIFVSITMPQKRLQFILEKDKLSN